MGNILATITDAKIYQTNGSLAKVISGTDYYAFGAAMPSRSYQDVAYTKYRYGFNGKENDDDFQDYGMRIYCPECGRFLSVDPIAAFYPMLSTYQYASLNPILNIDLDGLEGEEYRFKHTMELRKIEAQKIAKKHNIPYDQAHTLTNPINLFIAQAFKEGYTFDNNMARKFIDHYVLGYGETYSLTEKEMKAIQPSAIGLQHTPDFTTELNALKKVGDSKEINLKNFANADPTKEAERISPKAGVAGTLGKFTVIFKGILTKQKDGWSFKGTMQFHDLWDFDPQELNSRSSFSEFLVWTANVFLPGTQFHILSPEINIQQSSKENEISWFSSIPSKPIESRAGSERNQQQKETVKQ